MSEAAIATPPAAPSPTPAPSPSPAPTPSPDPSPAPAAEKPQGIARAMAEMEASMAKPAAAKQEATPKDGATPKDAKPENFDGLTDEQYDALFQKAGGKWHKAYEGYKAKVSPKLKEAQSLQAKIQELEAKTRTTPADDAKIAEYEKRIEKLNADYESTQRRLAESDYSRSDEYKKKFLDRWQQERSTAIEEVKGLRAQYEDADGLMQQRAATESDFLKAINLPPGEQDDFIHKTFGASAWRVINRITEMARIKREALEAVNSHAESYKTKQQQEEAQGKQHKEQFTKSKTEAHRALEEKWPKLFSTKTYEADPEAKAALESGYAFVDRLETELDSMPPGDQAAFASVIRARSAALPLSELLRSRAEAEAASLREELAKYRGSDPGKETAGRAAKQVVEEQPKGIEGWARKFDQK